MTSNFCFIADDAADDALYMLQLCTGNQTGAQWSTVQRKYHCYTEEIPLAVSTMHKNLGPEPKSDVEFKSPAKRAFSFTTLVLYLHLNL